MRYSRMQENKPPHLHIKFFLAVGLKKDKSTLSAHSLIAVMTSALLESADLHLSELRNLFNRELAFQNDYLRQENKILRSKLGRRVVLSNGERRVLVNYGLRIKGRLDEIVSIACRLYAKRPRHTAVGIKTWSMRHEQT